MIFSLTLTSFKVSQVLPINYQYPLSAAIYRIINRADEAYSFFLHDTGYRHGNKTFKLFTFSDITTPFTLLGDRLLMRTDTAHFQLAFHVPDAAEKFIKGLFMHQQLEIADHKSRAVFNVVQVETLPTGLENMAPNAYFDVVLQPLSPIVTGPKNEAGNYDYLSPEHAGFTRWLLHNWKEKYATVYGDEAANLDFAFTGMQVTFLKNPPRSRLITIKAGTTAETKIRGFTNFRLLVHGKVQALELALGCGLGLYNASGVGMVGVEKMILKAGSA